MALFFLLRFEFIDLLYNELGHCIDVKNVRKSESVSQSILCEVKKEYSTDRSIEELQCSFSDVECR